MLQPELYKLTAGLCSLIIQQSCQHVKEILDLSIQ